MRTFVFLCVSASSQQCTNSLSLQWHTTSHLKLILWPHRTSTDAKEILPVEEKVDECAICHSAGSNENDSPSWRAFKNAETEKKYHCFWSTVWLFCSHQFVRPAVVGLVWHMRTLIKILSPPAWERALYHTNPAQSCWFDRFRLVYVNVPTTEQSSSRSVFVREPIE